MPFSDKVKKDDNNNQRHSLQSHLIRMINNVENLPVVCKVSDKPADYANGNRHEILNIE